MRFVISGYYGFENSGDDALLLAIIRQIKADYDDAQITVLSRSPKNTKSEYGVNSVNRYNPIVILWHIFKCDLFVSGGGTLIQDETSTKSLIYYLTLIKTALFFKKKIMLYANGVGPLKSFKNIEKTKNVLNRVDLITLRDSQSLAELRHIGVNKPRIELTADPVILLNSDGGAERIFETYNIPTDKKIMCVSVREWKENPDDFINILADFCDYASEKYEIYTVLLSMQTMKDYEISRKIKNKMRNPATVVSGKYPFETLLSFMGKMYLCVGMRLHSIIYSAKGLVPSIGIVYDPKVKYFLDYIGEKHFIDVTDITCREICKLLDETCENYENIKSRLKFEVGHMCKNAEKNGILMKELIERGFAE